MTANPVGKLALLWRGDTETRRQATPENNRWHQIFTALATLNIHAEPAVYCEEAHRRGARSAPYGRWRAGMG